MKSQSEKLKLENEKEGIIEDLSLKIHDLKITKEISERADEIKTIVENVSVMLLCKTGEDSTLSERQKYIFKSLFGDFATDMYKRKIMQLQEEVEGLKERLEEVVNYSVI